jgi:hypothetical protein
LVLKSSGINVYNALAIPILLYVSASWTFEKKKKKDKKLLKSIEKTLFRRTGGYTLFDFKSNEILKELKVDPVDEKLRRYKSNWL